MLALLTAFLTATVAASVASIFSPAATFAITGFAACAVVTAPMLHHRYNVLSPWTLFAVVIYDSCGLRQLAVACGWNGQGSTNDELFLLGHGPSFFWWPCVLYVTGLAACAVGFVLLLDRPVHTRWPRWSDSVRLRVRRSRTTWRNSIQSYEFRQRAPVAVAALAIVGFLGFLLFVRATGGLDTASLSAKRSYGGVQVAAGYSSFGTYRLMAFFAVVAFWMYLAYLLRQNSTRWRVPQIMFALLLLLNAVLLPVYNSQRTDLGVTLLVSLAIFFAMRTDPRQRWRVAKWFALALLIGLGAVTMGRLQSEQSDLAGVSASHAVGSIGDVVIWNQNHGDMFTASHIMHAVPDKIAYAHGQTIATWLAAPVPRSIWPTKPRISPGPVIGHVIYGNVRSGVPPGLIGEMYWNFGVAGVLLGCLVVGLLLGRLSRWETPVADWSPATVLLTCALVAQFGFFILEEGVGGAIFQVGFNGVPLILGIAVCGSSPRVPRESSSTIDRPAVQSEVGRRVGQGSRTSN